MMLESESTTSSSSSSSSSSSESDTENNPIVPELLNKSRFSAGVDEMRSVIKDERKKYDYYLPKMNTYRSTMDKYVMENLKQPSEPEGNFFPFLP